MKMKPVDFRYSSYAENNVDSNAKDRRFKTGNNVRISKYKNIFAECYTPNWFEEVMFLGHTLLVILMLQEFLKELFTKKDCRKETKKNIGLKK